MSGAPEALLIRNIKLQPELYLTQREKATFLQTFDLKEVFQGRLCFLVSAVAGVPEPQFSMPR